MIYLFLFAHHYNGTGGYYPTPAEVRSVMDECSRAGLADKCTLFFDGLLAGQLAADPSLDDAIRAGGFPVGYHGEDTHGPVPVVEAFPELLGSKDGARRIVEPGWTFDQAVGAIRERYTHGFSGCGYDERRHLVMRTCTANTQAGGIPAVKSWIGKDIDVVTGHALFNPAAIAFRDVTSYTLLQDAGPFAPHLLRKAGAEWLLDAVESYLGRDVTMFWHMGTLALKGGPEALLPAWSHTGKRGGPGSLVRRVLESFDNSAPIVVEYQMAGDGTLDDALAYLKDFVSRNPGSAFVSAKDLAAKVHPPEVSLDPAAVASAVLAGWKEGPPDVLTVGGVPVSLADAWEVLGRSLAIGTPGNLFTSRVLGPIGDPKELVVATGAVSAADVIAAARGAVGAIDTHPRRAIPVNVTVGQTKVGFHQYLHLMAQAKAGKTGSLAIPAGSHSPPFARTLATALNRGNPALDFWMACQFWTIKPVVWR